MAQIVAETPEAASDDLKTGQSILVGTGQSTWVWNAAGWDLTHSDGSPPSSISSVALKCELVNVTIDPSKTALVIIDMQNIGLHKALDPPAAKPMYQAEHAILQYAIPAARKLNIQIVWLNWGLTELDLVNLPPAEVRVVAFKANTEKLDYGLSDPREDPDDPDNFLTCGESPDLRRVPGAELGDVDLDDGTRVNAGRCLMKGSWNTALHEPLASSYEKGKQARRPDAWINKNRNSGLWSDESALSDYLKGEKIRTLLFSGINTDQCVGSTLQDAHARGYDTIMLKDGCATDSLPYAKASYEFNCVRAWGFLSSCKALAKAAQLDYKA